MRPLSLCGVLMTVPPDASSPATTNVQEHAGEFAAIDSPEYDLALLNGEPRSLAEAYLRGFKCAATNTRFVLNLNISSPPARLAGAAGPLFNFTSGERSERVRQLARELAIGAPDGITLWW